MSIHNSIYQAAFSRSAADDLPSARGGSRDFRKRFVEHGDGFVHIGLRNVHWWAEADHVAEHAAAPDQQAVFARTLKQLQLLERTRENGLLVGRGGMFGNVIRFGPPMNIAKTDVDEAIAVLDKSFTEVSRSAAR